VRYPTEVEVEVEVEVRGAPATSLETLSLSQTGSRSALGPARIAD
jgi:hypothetical protein